MGTFTPPGATPLAPPAGRVGAFLQEAAEWAAGKSWLVRLPLVVYLAYAFVRHLTDDEYWSWFGPLSLGIHELGHVLFGFAPHFVTALAGGGAEVAVPLLGMWMFLRQPDYFGLGVLGCWLSYNLFGIAHYIADSTAQVRVYVSIGGGEAWHDWEYILTTLGLLEHEKGIAALVTMLAFATGLASLAWSGWVLWQMRLPAIRRYGD